MRKFIIGFLCGALIFSAGLVGADGISLVGKKIQSEAVVTLDGAEFDTAIIVDGKSYAPIRSVAEVTGLKVGYEKGIVKLETHTEEAKLINYWQAEIDRLTSYLNSTIRLVENTESKIQTSLEGRAKWQGILNGLAEDASESIRDTYEQRIKENIDEHAEIEAELTERQERVAEIEADLAHAKAELAKLQ